MTFAQGAVPLEFASNALVRAVADDALERDGEVLVLHGSDLTLLSSIAGAVVLETLHEPRTVAQLTVRLFDQFGLPEGVEPGEAVRQVLGALVDRRIVEVSPAP
ncbi:hypothetical protein [Demequina sp.]|uniref:hypothetical protein n=1 Tax=Demequina sp. TaxID=2050685 RepID=UPI003A8BE68B